MSGALKMDFESSSLIPIIKVMTNHQQQITLQQSSFTSSRFFNKIPNKKIFFKHQTPIF
jgi:hypothetical protein